MFTGRVDELVSKDVDEATEALEVLATEQHGELIRYEDAVHADRAMEVHLPRQATTQLDWLEFAAESFRERALDQTLEPVLELLESHGEGPAYLGRVPIGRRRLISAPSGEWRNWQTRRIQVPVSARTWGFKSPLAHKL